MAALVGYVREMRVRYYKPRTKSKDKELAEFSKTIQAALKVFINASYGVFGSPAFYFYCPPIAESTTAIARKCFLDAKKLAESMDLNVIAGDTDSIFVHKVNPEQMKRLQVWSIIELGIELGVDYVFRFLVLSTRKKNYFGVTTDNDMIVKGLAVKKSNTALIIKDTFKEITEILVKVQDEIGLKRALHHMIRILQIKIMNLRNGKIRLEELTHQTTLNKPFTEYQTKTPAVLLAIQEMDQNNEESIEQGEQFTTIKVKPFTIPVRTKKFPYFSMGKMMECKYKDLKNV